MKKLIFIGILAVLIFGAVKLVKIRKAEENSLSGAKTYPIVVKSFIPKEKNLTITLPYIATAKSEKEITVTSKFTGKIEYVKNIGDKVKKGEIVVKIDNTDLKAKEKEIINSINSLNTKLYALQINLKNLLKTHARTKELLKVKMASIEEFQNEESQIATLKSQIDTTKNSIKSLKENLKSIKNSLTYTIIKSPINGVVSEKFLNLGDIAFAGKPILKISSFANTLILALPEYKKEIIYKNKTYKLTPLNSTLNGLRVYKAKVDDHLINQEKVKVEIVEYKGVATPLPYSAILSLNDKDYIFNLQGVAIPIKILARGEKVVAVKGVNFPIILSSPDLFLKIKAGHPIKVKN